MGEQQRRARLGPVPDGTLATVHGVGIDPDPQWRHAGDFLSFEPCHASTMWLPCLMYPGSAISGAMTSEGAKGEMGGLCRRCGRVVGGMQLWHMRRRWGAYDCL